mmetsp:Transcript_27274/g.65722  ORF Transcript_27274/g.65722 Transcript_27274/m.65722 type:complete len:472 (-) Transcript_27274:124-1539(-)
MRLGSLFGTGCWISAAQVEVIEFSTEGGADEGPPGLPPWAHIGPMVQGAPVIGLRDVSSILPFARPFRDAPDGTPGDGFLHNIVSEMRDDNFARQMMPVIEARHDMFGEQHPCEMDVQRWCPHQFSPLHCLGEHAESISEACKGEIRHSVPFVCSREITAFGCDPVLGGLLPCLEERGREIRDQRCTDAVVATRHAMASAHSARALQPPVEKARPGQCPPSAGHGGDWGIHSDHDNMSGCCVKFWSRGCGLQCSMEQCQSHGMSFRWLDYRRNPYTCCQRPPTPPKLVNGCPEGFRMSSEGCCLMSWSWLCGDMCAKSRCEEHGWHVQTVFNRFREFRCCPPGNHATEAPRHPVTQAPHPAHAAHAEPPRSAVKGGKPVGEPHKEASRQAAQHPNHEAHHAAVERATVVPKAALAQEANVAFSQRKAAELASTQQQDSSSMSTMAWFGLGTLVVMFLVVKGRASQRDEKSL